VVENITRKISFEHREKIQEERNARVGTNLIH